MTVGSRDWINWAFMGVLAFLAARLVNSIDTLHIEMAKVTAIVGQHEKRLDKLEK